jgi:catalase
VSGALIAGSLAGMSCEEQWKPPQAAATSTEATALATAAPERTSASDVDVQIVDALNMRYGVHPGFRSNHAKGVVVEGNFTPTARAAELSRSPIFAGTTLPVTVRFSDASGLPDLHDAAPAARPYGMSIKFHLPDGTDSDIVTNTLKFFTVATPEDFRDLQLAAATSPPVGPKSAQFEAFLKAHPSVERANATLFTPDSFAHAGYFGIDAFVFINDSGAKQPFRYMIEPERVVQLRDEVAQKQQTNFLVDELPQRLTRDPVIFHLKAQLARPGDQTRDPTQPWPDDREVADLGIVTLIAPVDDSLTTERTLLFTPGRLTDGIEPSDDPLIAARDGSYAVSLGRRSPGLAGSRFQREAAQRLQRDRAATGSREDATTTSKLSEPTAALPEARPTSANQQPRRPTQPPDDVDDYGF